MSNKPFYPSLAFKMWYDDVIYTDISYKRTDNKNSGMAVSNNVIQRKHFLIPYMTKES
jgi:hypothetical protein